MSRDTRGSKLLERRQLLNPQIIKVVPGINVIIIYNMAVKVFM